jgi:hypothetical protein
MLKGHGSCSLSTIHLSPMGQPILKYRYSEDKYKTDFTVIDKSDKDNYKVNGEYIDQLTNEREHTTTYWYRTNNPNKDIIPVNYKAALDICSKVVRDTPNRMLSITEREEIKEQKVIPELPSDVSIVNKVQPESFLETSETIESAINILQEVNEHRQLLDMHLNREANDDKPFDHNELIRDIESHLDSLVNQIKIK